METTYFIFDEQFYKQVKGAPMGSPLSPVIANIYMEDFEKKVLESAPLKPRCWYRYVDDTFVIWQHGSEKLNEFLQHLNSVHECIQFTMELESDEKLPFLDVLVYKKANGNLGHTVYRKATHTDRYLHAQSHHHPTQIRSVANTLATRSKRIADEDNLIAERRHLQVALEMNGYPKKLFHRAWNRTTRANLDEKETEDTRTLVMLPYVKGTTDRIAKLLSRENIKTVFNTDMKIGALLRNNKDRIPLEGKGVYEVPCGDCNKTYVGQTGRNMSSRLQEHQNAVRQKSSTSSLAMHALENGHNINFGSMKALAQVDFLQQRFIREAIEIERRPHTLNKRDDGLRLPSAWTPLIAATLVKPTEPTKKSREQALLQVVKIDRRRKTPAVTNIAMTAITENVERMQTRSRGKISS